ncbi:hypothetical protein [Asaia astilbis]|uniref:hypothetical protein n=1 Tax=Asaia astilbis TaxID=610244 RepID=UPI0012EC29DB|nr:hypothetical protein [Asaia astilbis]
MALLEHEEGPIFLAFTSKEIADICGPRKEGEMLNEIWRYSALISLCRLLHIGVLRSWGLENANAVFHELSNSSLNYHRDTVLWETYQFALTVKGKEFLDANGVAEIEGPVSASLEKKLAHLFDVPSIQCDEKSASSEALKFWIEKLRYVEDEYPYYIP